MTGTDLTPVLSLISVLFQGTRTIFAGSSCNDLAVLDGSHIVSGHFDRTVRFWDTRGDTAKAIKELTLGGRVTALDLSAGELILWGVSGYKYLNTMIDSFNILDLTVES